MVTERMRSKRFISQNIETSQEHIDFDLLVYSIGYEARSRHIAEMYKNSSHERIAICYKDNQVLSYEENRRFSEHLGSKFICDEHAIVVSELKTALVSIRKAKASAKIAVDVSSMNRTVMASVLLSLYEFIEVSETISILYTPAKYHEPDLLLRPLTKMSPAHPSLSGVIGEPNLGRCVLLGLGYEYGLSLSILDSHEPDMAFIFRPSGFDARFEESVQEANFGFDFGERNYEVIDYNLRDISYLFNTMTNIIYSARHNTQFTAVPFGPKIFSAVAILCAAVHYPHLAVLRYSLGDSKPPVDVIADSHVVGCSLVRVSDHGVM